MMIKLGKIPLDGTPRIAVVITDEEDNAVITASRADILEVRADEFRSNDPAYVKGQLGRISETGLPVILTIRNDEAEGARRCMENARKLEIFSSAIALADAVDIELSSPIIDDVMKLARDNSKVVIVSAHDFRQTISTSALEALFSRAKDRGADIVKIAMQANTRDDVTRLMAFTLRHQQDNIIAISLGDLGSISRLVLPVMGSLLTFSYIGRMTAAGQLPLSKLQEHLRFYYPEYNEYFIRKNVKT